MRKLLLVGAAMLATTGLAQAQTQLVTDPVPPGVSGPFANGQPAPGPGQIAVRLNGAFNWYYGLAANGDIHDGGNKLTSVGSKAYIRLYPGFDGVAANGLRYGVAAEIRQDNEAGTASSPGSIASNGARGRLYWRRASGYIGGDSWGRIQFGSNDGPVTSMGSIGQFGNIGTGTMCGDTTAFNSTGAGPWPFFSCSGQVYTTNKIVYYTPNWAGFDFGLAYEPASAGLQSANECTAANFTAGACDFQSSATASTGFNRRRNTIDFAARYRGTVGGVGIAAAAGYINSGHVKQTGAGEPFTGLSVGYGGATLTFGGLTVGGSIQGGQHNGIGALKTQGARDQFSWQVGSTYTMGPVMFGVNYFEAYRQGSWTQANSATTSRTRRDRGFEAAINYGIAPGLSATLEYVWLDSRQFGADLNAIKGGPQNLVTTQQLIGGMHFRW